jgi:hypothetical protein
MMKVRSEPQKHCIGIRPQSDCCSTILGYILRTTDQIKRWLGDYGHKISVKTQHNREFFLNEKKC